MPKYNYPYFDLVRWIKVTLVDVVIEKYIYRIEKVVKWNIK